MIYDEELNYLNPAAAAQVSPEVTLCCLRALSRSNSGLNCEASDVRKQSRLSSTLGYNLCTNTYLYILQNVFQVTLVNVHTVLKKMYFRQTNSHPGEIQSSSLMHWRTNICIVLPDVSHCGQSVKRDVT